MSILRYTNNKKGQMTGMLWFFGVLFIGLFIAFMGSIGVAVLDWTADTTLPEFQELGTVDNTNFSEITELTLTPANNFIQALPGIIGVMYIMMLMGSLGLAYAFRTTENRWLLFLFFGLTVTLIMASIGMSIIYEDFYDDDDDLGSRLREQTMMSFLIMYSPALLIIIAVIGALLMFTGFQQGGIGP